MFVSQVPRYEIHTQRTVINAHSAAQTGTNRTKTKYVHRMQHLLNAKLYYDSYKMKITKILNSVH